jgi:hypothetical protein
MKENGKNSQFRWQRREEQGETHVTHTNRDHNEPDDDSSESRSGRCVLVVSESENGDSEDGGGEYFCRMGRMCQSRSSM